MIKINKKNLILLIKVPLNLIKIIKSKVHEIKIKKSN